MGLEGTVGGMTVGDQKNYKIDETNVNVLTTEKEKDGVVTLVQDFKTRTG